MLTPKEHLKLKTYISGIDVNHLARAFDALGEPNRCLIFRALLKGQEINVSELANIVGISESLASQHLKILQQAELIDKLKKGKNVYYFTNEKYPLSIALQKAVKI